MGSQEFKTLGKELDFLFVVGDDEPVINLFSYLRDVTILVRIGVRLGAGDLWVPLNCHIEDSEENHHDFAQNVEQHDNGELLVDEREEGRPHEHGNPAEDIDSGQNDLEFGQALEISDIHRVLFWQLI